MMGLRLLPVSVPRALIYSLSARTAHLRLPYQSYNAEEQEFHAHMNVGGSYSYKTVFILGLATGGLTIATVSQAETFAESIQECRTLTDQQQR